MDAWKEAQKTLEQAKDTLTSAVDGGIRTVSTALASGTSTAQAEAEKLRESAQALTSAVEVEAKNAESVAISYIKEGLRVAADNQVASAAVGTAVAIVVVPGLRRFVIRQMVGKFRSEEGRFRAAELQAAELNQTLEQQAADLRKLEERLVLAQEEYERGRSKLTATGQRLLGLSRQLRGSHASVKGLISELRQLPSRQALQLRSEVASKAADISKQRTVVERHISKLLKQGLV